jgi:hypothetical protein
MVDIKASVGSAATNSVHDVALVQALLTVVRAITYTTTMEYTAMPRVGRSRDFRPITT